MKLQSVLEAETNYPQIYMNESRNKHGEMGDKVR